MDDKLYETIMNDKFYETNILYRLYDMVCSDDIFMLFLLKDLMES